jgi:hypothetical protein
MEILTIDKIDQIINDVQQKHINENNFINELMNIDISDVTPNIASSLSNVTKNLTEVTDYTFCINETTISLI